MRDEGRGKRRLARDRETASVRPRSAAERERRVAPPLPADAAPIKRPRRSQAMQLAAEIERLQQELAAARARMAEIEARADVDPLTEILNRRGFERELKRSLAYVKRYGATAALIYLDLDGFKSVNDCHGHAAGDTVLKAVALVLGRQIRASDVVARLGGDEFGVLLWNLSETAAREKALVLEAAVGRITAHHGGFAISVGASAGVAMIQPLDQAAQLLERADRAMYARKAIRTRMPIIGVR